MECSTRAGCSLRANIFFSNKMEMVTTYDMGRLVSMDSGLEIDEYIEHTALTHHKKNISIWIAVVRDDGLISGSRVYYDQDSLDPLAIDRNNLSRVL